MIKKITLVCLSSILTAGLAHATAACNGFEIKLKNNTADDLLVHKIELNGAEVQPGGIQKINSRAEQVFTVNQSVDGRLMEGIIELHSITLPSKSVTLKFQLKNQLLVCQHDDAGSSSDYGLDKTRLPGHVTYTIGK